MGVMTYLAHRPFRPLTNKGDEFVLRWNINAVQSQSRTSNFGCYPSIPSISYTIVLAIVAIYVGATATLSAEKLFVSIVSGTAVAMLVVAVCRLGTFVVIVNKGDRLIRKNYFAGWRYATEDIDCATATYEIGIITITTTLFSFNPEPAHRFCGVLQGFKTPVILAMSQSAECIHEYSQELPPCLAGTVQEVTSINLRGPIVPVV